MRQELAPRVGDKIGPKDIVTIQKMVQHAAEEWINAVFDNYSFDYLGTREESHDDGEEF
jgi:hypothetical protein